MAEVSEKAAVAGSVNGYVEAHEEELALVPAASSLPEPELVPGRVTLDQVRGDPTVQVTLEYANTVLGVMGYTEHGLRHGGVTGHLAQQVLTDLGYPPREAELAAIAGFLHDIGNVVNRHDHAHSGALMAWSILQRLGLPVEEIVMVVAAIGNHDESDGEVVNAITAAVMLADKSDVGRSRVRNPDMTTFDEHDRVNYAVEHVNLVTNADARTIILQLTVDSETSVAADYFELFLSRMLMCRRAARFLGCEFQLQINGVRIF
jgi:metal-dependent HD superfamily phosphatase/phosphodiesterase